MEPLLGQKYHILTLNTTNTLYNGAKLIGYEQQHSTNIKLHNKQNTMIKSLFFF